MKRFSIILTAGLLTACNDSTALTRVLGEAGYKDIRHDDRPVNFICPPNDVDSLAEPFLAKTPKGQTVKGVVCSGVMQNTTIHLD